MIRALSEDSIARRGTSRNAEWRGSQPMLRSVRRWGSIGIGLSLLLRAASCSFVQGPVTGPGDINLVTGFDLSHVAYEKSEHFLAGLALAYKPTAPLTSDGALAVEA